MHNEAGYNSLGWKTYPPVAPHTSAMTAIDITHNDREHRSMLNSM